MNGSGKVLLVGAGPGDSGLITLRGIRALKQADAVLYDRLIPAELLAYANHAEKIYVGKENRLHTMEQDQIIAKMIGFAREGKTVVRLKGGDAYFLARGSEEAEALYSAEIPFDVIPGISAAFGVAAYAGIPLTHRDDGSEVHFYSGHRRENQPLQIDFASAAKQSGTLVFYMAGQTAPVIAKSLIKAGMAEDTPCAIVENGTQPCQRTITTSLDSVHNAACGRKFRSPCLFIVGKCVLRSERLNREEQKPLHGVSVLLTRSSNHNGELASVLREYGADVREAEAYERKQILFALPDLSEFGALIFTSGTAADVFFKLLFQKGDARLLANRAVGAVGSTTARALKKYGIVADCVPPKENAAALAQEMLGAGRLKSGDRVLLVRAQNGSPEIRQILENNRIEYSDPGFYKTVPHPIALPDCAADCIVFASPLAVECAADADKGKSAAVCIGEKTADAAIRDGYRTVYKAENASPEAVSDCILKIFAEDEEEEP